MLKTVMLRSSLIALACALSVTAHAYAADPKRVDVPAGDLTAALEALAKQSGVELVYQTDQLKGLRTQGVTGNFSLQEAVTKLLEGTKLTLKTDTSGAMLIALPRASSNPETPEPGSHSSRTPPVPLADEGTPLSLQGRGAGGEGTRSAGEEKKSFWQRLRLAQADTSSRSEDQKTSEDSSKNPQKRIEIEEIVVTGTHIRGIAPPGSPVITYRRDDIERSGVATVEQFVRLIPQNFALVDADTTRSTLDGGVNVSLGSSVNLRGLGLGSTLVLLNGHRLAPAGTQGSFTDVSMIPSSAIDRIEILTDGASAIYGADAVAGVVNFVLRRDFQGLESSVRYGATTRGGARELDISQAAGTSWSKGNVMLVYERHEQDALRADQRDFIPTQDGPFMILPEQQRDSAFVAARHAFLPQTVVQADAIYSERDFTQDVTQFGAFQHTTGSVQQSGGTLGLTQGLARDWKAELVGSYSKQKEDFLLVDPTFTQASATQSETGSVDLRADGRAFEMFGIDVRASLGLGFRIERFDSVRTPPSSTNPGTGLRRDVCSAFGEVHIPLINPDSGGNDRLELSLAARFDDYEDVGSSTNPKVGVLWSPMKGLNFRGTYATSFRVAPLASLSDRRAYTLLTLPDPVGSGGSTNTLILSSSGNPGLRPEESESFTFGVDFIPAAMPDLSLSASWFHIDYTDRIANVPLVGSVTTLFSQANTLAPFIDLAPDPAEVQRVFAEETLSNRRNIPASAVEAIFDIRKQNIASSVSSGIDLAVQYKRPIRTGTLGLKLDATYLLDSEFTAASTTPGVQLVDKILNPMDLRFRAGLNWSRGGFASSLIVNYLDAYENNLVTPVGTIDSWTTADLQLSYAIPQNATNSILQGLGLSVSVLNLTNEDPPSVVSDINSITPTFGYDPTNASPRGRVIAAQVTKRW